MPTTATAATRRKKTSRRDDEAPLIPILARKVREIEAKSQRGKLGPTNRVKFQVIAFLVREERARVKADAEIGDPARAELLKRLDGVATILAKTAARDTSLIQLLEADQATSPVAKRMRRDWLLESGAELAPGRAHHRRRRTGARSPRSRSDRGAPGHPAVRRGATVGQPLPRSRPDAAFDGHAAPPSRRLGAHGSAVQGFRDRGRWVRRVDGSAAGAGIRPHLAQGPRGHGASVPVPRGRQGRTPQLPPRDEPGLGKTAQSVLAASVAGAYPLLVVVPNVVKMNWAREVERWTPQRRATVIQGDGDDIDAFADVFIVNYEILDRHMSWLASIGLRGMVVDEAHFIKNLSSQRSQNVLSLARPGARAHSGARSSDARPHRYAADQRRRGLRRDLALPRLDHR